MGCYQKIVCAEEVTGFETDAAAGVRLAQSVSHVEAGLTDEPALWKVWLATVSVPVWANALELRLPLPGARKLLDSAIASGLRRSFHAERLESGETSQVPREALLQIAEIMGGLEANLEEEDAPGAGANTPEPTPEQVAAAARLRALLAEKAAVLVTGTDPDFARVLIESEIIEA